MVHCGNNNKSHKLKQNGGDQLFGSPSECYKKGYAGGYNQHVKDVKSFVEQWSGAYEAYIRQQLFYGSLSEKVPPGYQRALLSQSMQRGYAHGSMALAKKLQSRTVTTTHDPAHRP